MKTRIQARLCILALVVLGVAAGNAGTYYVTPTGTGGGTGWGDPTSLTNALRICPSNDAIWMTGGTYSMGAVVTVSNAVTLIGGFAGTESAAADRALTNALGVVTNYSAINGENSHKCLAITANADVWLDTLSISNSPSERSLEKSSGTGKLTLNNCRIENNRGPGDYSYAITGGGVGGYFSSGSVLMTNCVVFGNRCDGYQKYGTGISGQSMILDIVDCVFQSNTNKDMGTARGSRGGGLAFHSGTCRVVRTEFINNQAAANNIGGGGAIFIGGGTPMVAVISNCLFRGNNIGAENKAGYGGALNVNLAAGKTVDVVNCTFTTNVNLTTASGRGGAIYLAAGTLNLKNCILWTNRVAAGSSGHEVGVAVGHSLNIRYSDITGTTSPHVDGSVNFANCLSRDPLFASATDQHLQSPAGRWDPGTKTWLTSDTVYSPCIDAGDPDDSIGDEPTDNGNARINLGYYGGTAQASKSPPPQSPYLEDGGATVAYDRAWISGQLTNDILVNARIYLCYGTSSIPGDTTNGWESVLSLGDRQNGAAFPQWTPTLLPTTTYYYRWFATNSYGSDWTSAHTFDTGEAAPGGGGNVIHVNKGATGAADGTSWPHAYTKIGDGITAISGSRSNIWITGVSYGEGTMLSLAATATLIGGFAGTETSVAGRALTNAFGVVTNRTAIDGENSHSCLKITAGNAWIDSITFSNTPYDPSTGGALSKGGAGTLVLNNCEFVRNRYSGYGAAGLGCGFTGGTVLMTNCQVSSNAVIGNTWNHTGVGIYSVGASLTLVDCSVSGNDNNGAGGSDSRGTVGFGLYFDNGTLLAERTDFIGNVGGCNNGSGGGTAIYFGINANMAATLRNCVFRGNRALDTGSGKGGAIWANLNSLSKTVTVVNCTFSDNRNETTGGAGGAVYMSQGTLTLKNSIFWTNSVKDGVSGSEIYAEGSNSRVLISHSDLTGTNVPSVVATNSAVVSWGDGVLTTDPLYASVTDVHLKSKGGRWDPGTATWVKDSVTSPCIDAGDPGDPVGIETQPNGRRINMGAYGGTVQASRTMLFGTVLMVR